MAGSPSGKAANNEEEDDFTFPLVTDNNKPKPTGRKTNIARQRETEGKTLRDNLCTSLYANGNVRPKAENMKYNDFGHAYFE